MSSRSISGELSHKIIIAIAVLVLGGILGIILYSGRTVTEFAKRNAEESMGTFQSNVEDMLKEVEMLSATAGWLSNDHIGNPGYMQVINEKIVMATPMAMSSTIAFVEDLYGPGSGYSAHRSSKDLAGTVTSSIYSDYASEGWYTEALSRNEGVWSEPYEASGGEGLVTTYSSPLRTAAGQVFAIYSVDVSLEGIAARLAQEHFFENSYSVIISPEGRILSHPDSTLLLKDMNELALQREDKPMGKLVSSMTAGEEGIGEVRSEKSAAIYGPIRNGWSAAIICPGNELFGGVVKFQLFILLISLMDLLVLYLVTRTIISRTLLPITEVTYLAKNVAKGNFKAQIPKVEGNNEMFHLHEALRNMLHSINDYIEQLKTTTTANERFESELAIASNIQKQMLRTDFINDEEVDLFAVLKPAKEVGGDMYDFLRVGRTVYFAVGDVSGKGVPAALYMAISRSLFHYVSGMSLSTSNIVSCINSSFCSGNDSNMFITLFVGRLDLDTREMVFCNAGHNPIIIISPDGEARYIHAKSNLAAGVYDEFQYEKESIFVEKGSRLLIYTDGVTEAENAAKELFGEQRLLEFAGSQSPDMPSKEFVDKLTETMKAFTLDNEQNDDITILSARV